MKFKKVFEEVMTTVWASETIPTRNFRKEANPENISSTGFTDISNTASIYVKDMLGPDTKKVKNDGSLKIAHAKKN